MFITNKDRMQHATLTFMSWVNLKKINCESHFSYMFNVDNCICLIR